ncbi:MAG: pyridoxal 5'-phosphate synthase glutaminase subunit PdxT [Dehalococcoidia bacterium]|nr:pyridoxal 5'-phosphate synthase glutaminase subunit PdxT [Dehalococcoidia bacterium]
MTRVGVLAIQGDFLEHRLMIEGLGVDAPEVRLGKDLAGLDGLVIPGGESTTIVQLLDIFDMRNTVVGLVREGLPVWGTCAGMIVLADRLTDHRPEPLHLMDIEVSRNAFGSQVDSFEADLEVDGIGDAPFRGVFIRAPVVNAVGQGVEVLARLSDGRPVAVRENDMLATAFHPELTGDSRVHNLFLNIVRGTKAQQPS